MAHDLNNLIMRIFGHCDALDRGLESGGVDPRRIEGIREEATHVASLARKLTDLSRRPPNRAVEVNLNRQILDLEELLRRLVPERVGLSLALDPDVGPIRIDPVQLGHVVVGLVMNACDVMPDGGPLSVTTRNVVTEEGATRRAEITVRCTNGAFEVRLPTV
jgi:signal transduction histidine kinase